MTGPITAAAPPAAAATGPVLRVTYRKSAIGYARDQRATVAALGLHRLHQTVDHPDSPALRGMIRKVRHLVSVDGLPADSPAVTARLTVTFAAAASLPAPAAPPEAPPVAPVAAPAPSGSEPVAEAATGEPKAIGRRRSRPAPSDTEEPHEA